MEVRLASQSCSHYWKYAGTEPAPSELVTTDPQFSVEGPLAGRGESKQPVSLTLKSEIFDKRLAYGTPGAVQLCEASSKFHPSTLLAAFSAF
jgi:hypothetical protein